jgi:hypothetical protein
MAKKNPLAQPEQEAAQQVEQENPDAEILVGGPGQEEAQVEESEQPQLVEITISGKKYRVTPEVADAMSQRERDFDRKLNLNTQELGDLRKFKRQFDQPPQPSEPKGGVDYDTLIFEKPSEALKAFKEELRKEFTSQYQADKKAENFWRSFYAKNNDLDPVEDDDIVQTVVARNWGELGPMEPGQAQERIAELARDRILRMTKRFHVNGNGNDRTIVEPSSSPMPKAPAREDTGPKTMSDIIRKRRQARTAKGVTTE